MGEPWKRRLQQLSVTEKHVPLRNQLQRSISVPAPVHKLHLSTGAIAINLGAFFGSWAVACELTTPSRGNFCGSLWLRMLASSYAQFTSSAPSFVDALAEFTFMADAAARRPARRAFSVACMNENWENGAIASSRSVGCLLIGGRIGDGLCLGCPLGA